MSSSPRRRAALAATLIAGSALFSACGDDTQSELPEGVALSTYTGESTAQGDVTGTLKVQDNCLVLAGKDGTTYVPRWPAGKTAYLEDSITVDGERYDVGTEVTLPSGNEADKVKVPASCEDLEGTSEFTVAT